MIQCKFNFNIEYSPSSPYQRVVWDYNQANIEKFKQRSIEMFD